ncbi:MAG TPA: acyl carrier protein [Candidatus Gallacutalibacter pullistercoris]|nr:acyl carrier protein [Candidatus Gallacutalibacter pullistercoris]
MVFEKVKAILSEQFDVEEDTITNDTTITEDLGADSLDVVDLLMSIEDEFEIEVPDTEIENIKTVGELVKYIEDHV